MMNKIFTNHILLLAILLPCSLHAAMVGNVTGYNQNKNTITVSCDKAKVQIQVWDDDIIRVWLSEDGKFDYYNSYNQYMIQPGLDHLSGPESLIVTDVGYLKIQTSKVTVRVNKKPFRLSFYQRDNKTLITQNPESKSLDTSFKAYFDRDAAGTVEHFYGLPQAPGKDIDQRDATVTMDEGNGWGWAVPFFMSSSGYGIFFHNEYGSENTLTMGDPIVIENTGSKGQLDLFFIYGPDLKDVLDNYTVITGRPPMYPKKMLGFQYICDKDQRKNEGDFDDLRDGGYAVDSCITFIDELIPDNSDMVKGVSKKLHKLNGASVGYLDVHPEAGNGPGNFSDLKPEDHSYPHDDWDQYKSLLKSRMLDHGVDWFWIDETDSYDETFQFHHLRATFEAMEEYDHRRGGMCSRGGYAGCQRFAYPWMGDVKWGKDKIVANLKNALAGVAHSTHDLASYKPIKPEDTGRMQRGIKINLFNPITQLNNWKADHMPWDFDQETQGVYKSYINLHYRLLPYWYTMVWQANQKGLPDRRPLVLYYQDDENVYNSDEFMSGEWFLFAPVYDSDTRDVYLPDGKWFYYFDNKEYEGPVTLKDFKASVQDAHLFVKAGAIIPMGPEMMYVDQKPIDPLTLKIYPHESSTYTLYEDDGKTRKYKKGEYCTTQYDCTQDNGDVMIKINKRTGKYMPARRKYLLEVLQEDKPIDVTLNKSRLKELKSLKDFNNSSSGYFYGSDKFLRIKFKDTGLAITINIKGSGK
jgi:alpha-glucosidase